MKSVQTPFGKLTYTGTLTGKTVIIAIHGLGGSAAYFKMMTPYLQQYDVLAFNLLGTPPSDNINTSNYTVKKAAQSLWAAIDKLQIITPVILIGHSLGGSIATEMLTQRSIQVKALILISTSVTAKYIHLNPSVKLLGFPVISSMIKFVLRHLQRWLSYRSLLNSDNISDPRFIIEPLIQKSRIAIKQELTLFARYTANVPMDQRLMPYSSIPTLIIFGDQDQLATN
ncbi:alpha/beta hydrolase [Loigolactobacillus backii]|uniref:Uncharacterized protein n=1 Tax=Loigolactobacillus backii TaxID=375175 RepID=A0A192H285_9LACO|nr:alpha/beta hydrolase [Loigolactobacillus backii]ANK60210.1 hypothetical protein AYR52_08120 [Loigolactobacillus backii]ANK62347.1 hypothetical protein AYR53_05865 [Loigolactobacillus backii]ANK65092.1 hypothetical protein AYR54_07530 [Loigolactobacillus backii]ANK67651.1 hypothetical protein AYR55_08135 [Loigolactobacillus backii]ANK70641.1 hypothetical protein AYR56_11125 [Loigolactobacillus backii]